jgi:predicted carbohydrate-binding protein with CBM5 and CBM33 domain
MRSASIIVGLLLAHAATAHAHIALTFPTPRTTDQKAGPCGATGSTRGTKIATFQPGQTITVEWDETVDHPGHFRIAFDEDGNDVFQNPQRSNDNYPSTLVDQITDKSGGHYSQQITLPNKPCTNCTLQLMQIMTTVEPYNSFYYQCADIVISGDAEPTEPTETDGGCGAGSGAGLGAGIAALGLVLRRRRR